MNRRPKQTFLKKKKKKKAYRWPISTWEDA